MPEIIRAASRYRAYVECCRTQRNFL